MIIVGISTLDLGGALLSIPASHAPLSTRDADRRHCCTGWGNGLAVTGLLSRQAGNTGDYAPGRNPQALTDGDLVQTTPASFLVFLTLSQRPQNDKHPAAQLSSRCRNT